MLREIGVKPMTDDEARFVITEGMKKLDLAVADDLIDKTISAAAGSPGLLQEFCLDSASNALDNDRSEVAPEDLEYAIDRFVKYHHHRLYQRYMTAIETVGPKRYRKQVLRAMAESPNNFVTMEELVERVGANLKEPTPATALSGPLRELKGERHGKILGDVDQPAHDGSRVHNLTTFTEAEMKAFVRAVVAVENRGLLPAP